MSAKDVGYELLPFVYAAVGVATLVLSGETIGRASGVLLITAALIIFRLRLEYRRKRAEDAEEELQHTQIRLKKAKSLSPES